MKIIVALVDYICWIGTGLVIFIFILNIMSKWVGILGTGLLIFLGLFHLVIGL
jgi:hypothetical protein